jgi:hypothetical protein
MRIAWVALSLAVVAVNLLCYFVNGHHWYNLAGAAAVAGMVVYQFMSARRRDRNREQLFADWATRYGYDPEDIR